MPLPRFRQLATDGTGKSSSSSSTVSTDSVPVITTSLGFDAQDGWDEMPYRRDILSLISIDRHGPLDSVVHEGGNPSASDSKISQHESNLDAAMVINGVQMNGFDGLPAEAQRNVQTLVAFLNSCPVDLAMQVQGLLALGNKIYMSMELRRTLLHANGLSVILRALQVHQDNSHLQTIAVWLLFNLSLDKEMAASVARANAVPVVCNCLERWPPARVPIPLQEMVSFFFYNQLSWGDAVALTSLRERKERVMAMLRSWRDSCASETGLQALDSDKDGGSTSCSIPEAQDPMSPVGRRVWLMGLLGRLFPLFDTLDSPSLRNDGDEKLVKLVH